VADGNEHCEVSGKTLATKLREYIEAHGGQFLRDEAGLLYVALGGKRIQLNLERDNQLLAELMLAACDVTLLSHSAQVAIQRLQVNVMRDAGQIQVRRFSALSVDRTCLYVPLAGGNILEVTAQGTQETVNGENGDRLWCEHPNGEPLRFCASSHDGLQHFERLLVNTQACTSTSMRWLVAMHLGLFPYVRDLCPARFIMVFIGRQQSGKTSGAARFTYLHGLGEVKGDYSVAALSNIGDIGLLVMDNKEQQNFTQEYIDFLLFLATGAERGRSYSDGRLRPKQSGRPAGVITTIEGVIKAELQARCVEVQYEVPGARLQRDGNEREISKLRHEMGSALIGVIVQFLKIRDCKLETPNPAPNFQEHFTVLCNLLRAFGRATDRPAIWSEEIIAEWGKVILGTEADDDDLEHPLDRVLREYPSCFARKPLTFGGVSGMLYVVTASELLTLLQRLNLRELKLPKTPNGLTRRLNSSAFHSFIYLNTDTPTFPLWRGKLTESRWASSRLTMCRCRKLSHSRRVIA
jgi:hypothetical protein